jgi:hypothetical protein
LKFKFDLKNGFSNYEGTQLLSHYHEAAYDGYMTGIAFGHVLKMKEIDDSKFAGKKGDKQPHEQVAVKHIKNTPINE